jgi:hypothetical protein
VPFIDELLIAVDIGARNYELESAF